MRLIWIWIVLMMSLLGGCGVSSQLPTPTTPLFSATPIPANTPTRSLTATPTPRPTITPSPSPQARAEIILLVVDCTWKFCPPEELEQQVIRVIGKPGIYTAEPISELHVRLVYDPIQLTAEAAIELFADTTSLEVEESQ